MRNLWKNYRHRFVPWLAINLQSRIKREVTLSTDKVISDTELESQILNLSSSLHANFKSTATTCSVDVMYKELGFSISLCESRIRGGGKGVVLSSGCAEEGDLIAMYPGTLYRRFEPILLPSIGNSFVLRCMDGIHVDGNNRYLSKLIFKSCVRRDSDIMRNYTAADMSWASGSLKVPWNIGQYVNNSVNTHATNVAYQELDLINFPPELDYLLPNIWFSGPRGRNLRVIVLVAIKDIKQGDEILSNYVTLLHSHTGKQNK